MLTFDKVPIIGRPTEGGGLESYGLQLGEILCGSLRVGCRIGSRSVFRYGKDLSAVAVAVRYFITSRVITNQAACVAVAGAEAGAYVARCIAVRYCTIIIITNQAACVTVTVASITGASY